MEDRHRVAEAGAEATDRLRRERDLGDEHDRAQAAGERRRARLQVDLGLAAAGRAGEQEVLTEALVEGGGDAADGCPLLLGQDPGLRFPRERLPSGRRRTLRPRCAAERRDELECPGGRRAVVVGEPQRQVDEGGRDLVEHAADLGRLDPGRGLDADVCDHAPGGGATQPNRDDGALAHALRHLVRERAGE